MPVAEAIPRNLPSLAQVTIERAVDFVLWVDATGRVRWANESGCQRFGYTREEMTELSIPDLNAGVTLPVFRSVFERVRQFGNVTFEGQAVRKDGTRIPVEINAHYVPFDGEDYLCSFGRDISARKRAERGLREALAQVEALSKRLAAENVYLQEEIRLTHGFDEIVGASAALHAVLGQVEQVAPTDATVLLLGETGTGKELLARAVHDLSRRRARPLVKVNCGALPEHLIESELFGHEKGAFTGAERRRTGRFELADGGTLFLDEIGDLAPALQVKLLRVLQDGSYERLGDATPRRVDVRVIAATNRDLRRAMAEGAFRSDLFYRLNVFPLYAPPLRERRDDIPRLVRHFAQRFGTAFGRPVHTVPERALAALCAYDWPGNVRELENVVERAVILSRDGVLAFPDPVAPRPDRAAATPSTTLEAVMRRHIESVLTATQWRVRGVGGAADLLGLKPTTLESRMQRLGLVRPA